ncbi:DNA polymerase I [compost metagenome]
MRFLAFDAETLYCTKTGYTLSRMTAEEYVRDSRFELIGFALGYLGQPKQWYTGDLDYLRSVARSIDWSDTFVVGHNASMFDSLILTEVLGVRPAHWGCTLQLARCLHGSKDAEGKNISNSLSAVAKLYRREIEALLGRPLEKGDEVVRADGKRRCDFTDYELAKYGQYCIDDTDLADAVWRVLSPKFPKSELFLASTVTKMWAEPRIQLDTDLLAAMKVELAERKAELLTKVADLMGVGATMAPDERLLHTQKLLRSDLKFAELLRAFDVEPPTKLSPKRRDANGRALEVYAFSKTDQAMTELLEYEESEDEDTNLAVQALAAARIGSKSTIAESRVDRFLGISQRGLLPVPLEYGKTLTHRLSGGGRLNMQNMSQTKPITKRTPPNSLIVTPAGWSRLSKRAPDMSQILDAHGRVWNTGDCHVAGLRDTLMAPPGYRLVVCDSSTIELRVAHALCGERETVDALRRGEDLYCRFASVFFSRPITKADKKERQHGKVAMLQLQYQAGAESFRKAARIMAGVRMNEVEAQATVDIYRSTYTNRCGTAARRPSRNARRVAGSTSTTTSGCMWSTTRCACRMGCESTTTTCAKSY